MLGSVCIVVRKIKVYLCVDGAGHKVIDININDNCFIIFQSKCRFCYVCTESDNIAIYKIFNIHPTSFYGLNIPGIYVICMQNRGISRLVAHNQSRLDDSDSKSPYTSTM